MHSEIKGQITWNGGRPMPRGKRNVWVQFENGASWVGQYMLHARVYMLL